MDLLSCHASQGACNGVSTAVALDSALESVSVPHSDIMVLLLTRRASTSSATVECWLGFTLGLIGHASAPLHIKFLRFVSNLGIIGGHIAGLIGGLVGGLIGNLGLLTDSSYTCESPVCAACTSGCSAGTSVGT